MVTTSQNFRVDLQNIKQKKRKTENVTMENRQFTEVSKTEKNKNNGDSNQ